MGGTDGYDNHGVLLPESQTRSVQPKTKSHWIHAERGKWLWQLGSKLKGTSQNRMKQVQEEAIHHPADTPRSGRMSHPLGAVQSMVQPGSIKALITVM